MGMNKYSIGLPPVVVPFASFMAGNGNCGDI